jgi:hypothetical protein
MQGFLIFSFHEDQNKFHVFREQKSAFFEQKCAKKRPFLFHYILCHMTYQKLRLEARILNFHFTWGSKWISCLLQAKKRFYRSKSDKKRAFSFQFKRCHVMYQKLRPEARVPNFQFLWGSKWIYVLQKQKSTFLTKCAPKSGLIRLISYCVTWDIKSFGLS